jgi:hypothetical protein
MGTQPVETHWIRNAALPSFVIQLIASTVGAMIMATIALFLPALVIAAFTENTSGGNFFDHVVDQRLLHAGDEPYFLAPILAGFVLGGLSHRFFGTRAAAWVWVPPAVVLLWNIFTWKNGGYRPYWPDVWHNYFGSDCGGSECLYELFVTAPFYTSVAYSLGWIIKHLTDRRQAN